MNDALMKTLASLSAKEREELAKALGNFSAPHKVEPTSSPTIHTKTSKPKGADTYRNEDGARYVLSILLDAFANPGVQRVIPYHGKASSTIRTRYYRARSMVIEEDLLPDGFDMECVDVTFKKLYGVIEYSTAIKERKNYNPVLGLEVVDRIVWKEDLLKFLEDDRKELVYKDNIKLNEEDRSFVESVTDGICRVEALADTWMILKK